MRKEHAPKMSRKKDDVDFEIAFYENILHSIVIIARSFQQS